MNGLSGVQCACGRFLAQVYGIFRGESLSEVRGRCSRCGPDALAMHGPDCWWWASDFYEGAAVAR